MRLVGGWSDIDSEAREYQEIMRQKLPRPTHGQPYAIPMGITPGIYDLDEGFDVSKTESKKLGLHSDEIFVFRDKGSQELREEIKRFWMSGKQFQEAGLLHKRGIMLYGPPACLDEDTYISYHVSAKDGRKHNKKGGSIRRLFQRFHKIPTKGKGFYLRDNTRDSDFFVSSINEDGMIIKNKVNNVVHSGIKQVFKLTTESGLSIQASADHKFWNGERYVKLSDLHKGDIVFIHNNTQIKFPDNCKDKNERYKELMVKYHPMKRTKIVQDGKGNQYTYYRIRESRAVVEAHINNMTLEQYVDFLNTGAQEEINRIKFLPKDLHVHHVNEDKSDNRIENLMIISGEDHSRHHVEPKRVQFWAVEDRVSSIESAGFRDTYDICCDFPYHNFVANGFVVHNSGKTTMIRQEMKELAKTQIVFFSKSPYQLQRILAEVRAADKKIPITVVMEDIDELANGWGLHGLLEMLDGANAQDRILYIGTTNNLTEMPEKLKRPGRFDRKINIPNPDKSLRMEYIQKKFPKLNEQQMKSLTDLTEDLSFGHLREIVVSHLGYKIPLKDAVARVREDVKLERSAEKKAY